MFLILAENQARKEFTDVVRIWAGADWQPRLLTAFQEAVPSAVIDRSIRACISPYHFLMIHSIHWQINRPNGWIEKAHAVTLNALLSQEAIPDKSRFHVVVGSQHIGAEIVVAPAQERSINRLLAIASQTDGLLNRTATALPNGFFHIRLQWATGGDNREARHMAHEETTRIRQRIKMALFFPHAKATN